jgi:hypothetical protein
MDLKEVAINPLNFTCIVLKLSEATNHSGGKTVAVVKNENCH